VRILGRNILVLAAIGEFMRPLPLGLVVLVLMLAFSVTV